MAIVKPMSPTQPLLDDDEMPGGMDVDLGDASTEENEDGGMTVTFGDNDEDDVAGQNAPFDANLAEYMDDSDLESLSHELMRLYDADYNSRAEWERVYTDGLDLLGIAYEDRNKPWPGACGVYHPVLAEAVVRFEAQAIMEIFPPQGPAKTMIQGQETPERIAQAQRVQTELNYLLTKKMTDYRDETESLLFRLPLAGSAFRKVYYDQVCQRPAAKFVPAEDFVVSYGETDLRSCGRYTFIDRISANDLRKRQASGFYRDIELSEPVAETSQFEAKNDELTGIRPDGYTEDRYTVLEIHVDWDLEGFEDKDADGGDTGIGLPYVISVEKQSGKILSVYRNWKQADSLKQKKCYFVHYKYLPGLGFYGFGLIHLVGGLAKSSTSILRQLVDAGTLSNLPGGLKSRGLRIKGDDTPIRPGEFRDVDLGSGKISDAITFIPYKEPSMVLYQLLGNIVDEARRVGSIADLEVGDMKQEAPVGTTLALMERALKVMSAVQARNHFSLEQELGLIADVISTYMPSTYDYDVGGNFNRQQDFAGVDIVPVSDPGATTMSQRVVQYQAVIALASQNPQLYDMRKLNLDMLNVLGIKDAASLVPDPANIQPADPVTENQNILNGAPVKAFQPQDHKAHIAVHMAMVQDPQIQAMIGQSPKAALIQGAMASHIADHMGFEYRQQIEQALGTQLPPMGTQLPPDIENQLSGLVAQASQRVLQQHQQEQAQAQAQQTAQDPLVQLQARELDLKQAEITLKGQIAHAETMLKAMEADAKNRLEDKRIDTQKEIAGAQLGAKVAGQKAQQTAGHRTAMTEKAMDLVDNERQRQADLEQTVVGKGMDIAGKIAAEKAKPTPAPAKPMSRE